MTKRLALFEFIAYNEAEDFSVYLSNLVKNIKAINEEIGRVNKTDIDVYASEGARAQLRKKATDIILHLAELLKATPKNLSVIQIDVNQLQDILYILRSFKSEITSEAGIQTITNIKNILARTSHLFPNRNADFRRGTNIDRRGSSDLDQVIVDDPEGPVRPEPSDEEKVMAKAIYQRRLGM